MGHPKQSLVLGLLVAATLSGCATTHEADQRVAASNTQASQYLVEATKTVAPNPVVTESSGIWVARAPIPVARLQTLPKVFGDEVTLMYGRPLTVRDIAGEVTRMTGIPVRLAPDFLMVASAKKSGGTSDSSTSAGGSSGGDKGSEVAVSSRTGGSREVRLDMNYRGPLTGLLDYVVASVGGSWGYRDGVIEFYQYETRTFSLYALPGGSSTSAKISTASTTPTSAEGGAASVSGGGQQSTEMKTGDISAWRNIQSSIQAMLSPGGVVVLSEATGSLTVTDTPQVLTQVAEFVKHENLSLSRQIMVQVKVLTVIQDDSDNYGLNWDAVFKELGGRYGLSFKSAASLAEGAGALVGTIVGPSGSALSQWQGTNAIIDALSKQGRIANITSGTVTTLNNQPVPMQVADQISYLKSVSITNNGSSSAPSGSGSPSSSAVTSQLTPGQLTTGYTMNLLPHVLQNDRMLLQVAIDQSSLTSMGTAKSGNSSIQTPNVATSSFTQRVSIRSGQTMVLSGFEQNISDVTRQGIGDASNWVAGGGLRAKHTRTAKVILVTPVIADGDDA